MLIANPIYDVVFKRLLENQTIAKGLLSRILGQEILELDVCPQEITSRKDEDGRSLPITLYRVDFRARVRTKSGEEKSILLELQKAKLATDITRFRQYLGSQYQQRTSGKVAEPSQSLPITTIYFLNFLLDAEFPKVIHVAREYRDAISQKTFAGKHEFIEKLTHDSFIIQVPKLDDDHSTDLEEALRIFDQRFVLKGDPHMIQFQTGDDFEDELLKEMVRELEKTIADPDVERIMEVEDEIFAGQLATQKKLEAALVREKQERTEKELAQAEAERLAALLKDHGIDPEADKM